MGIQHSKTYGIQMKIILRGKAMGLSACIKKIRDLKKKITAMYSRVL